MNRRQFFGASAITPLVALLVPALARGDYRKFPEWHALNEVERKQAVDLLRSAWENGSRYQRGGNAS